MTNFDSFAPHAQHDLIYDTPALRWDEALPLGNGIMGALVWGDGSPLRLSLDRADLWDLSPIPEFETREYSHTQLQQWRKEGDIAAISRTYDDPYFRAAPTKIPAGRIELQWPDGATFSASRLHLDDATATMSFADGSVIEVLLHATEPVGMARVLGTAKAPQLHLIAPQFAARTDDEQEVHSNVTHGDLAQLGYAAAQGTAGDTWRAFVQQGAQGFSFAVHVAWRQVGNEWLMAWSVASSREESEPAALAKERVEKALEIGYEGMLASHRAWWREYSRRSSIALPNKTLERQWYLEQYKFGAASRRGAPPITLQAVWTADEGTLPPWKGDYHHDLNTQLSYWPCYSANHLEEGLSFLDWLWQTRETCKAWTQAWWKMPGLNVPGVADLENRAIGGWVQYTFSGTISCWLAQHFYLHWKYSADREFLQERAYPYLRDVAVFIEAATGEKDARGKRTLALSSSPEMNDNRLEAWFDGITNHDLSLMRWLLSATCELADEEKQPDDIARWTRVLAELPELAQGEDGRLLIAPDYPLPTSHRHLSHLMAIHPLGLINWDDGEAAQRTISASLQELEKLGTDSWCGYSYAWLSNLQARARDGDGAERSLETFSTAFTSRNSFHLNGDQSGRGYSKYTDSPFTLEGNFAAAAGIQEMLLQSTGGVIRVFPAIPAAWQDVSFSTLRACGAFLVSAERKDGKTVRLEIIAERGGLCRVVSPFSGDLIETQMRPGQRISFA